MSASDTSGEQVSHGRVEGGPARRSAGGPTLAVVGAGLRLPDHLTVEALRILEQSDRIFTVLSVYETLALPAAIRDKCEYLEDLFDPERPRHEAYYEMARRTLDACAPGIGVSHLARGNPGVLNTVTELLVKGGAAMGIGVRVVPGVSAIDTVLIDMGYDPRRGLQLVEATAAVQEDIKLDPRMPCMVLQPHTFGTDLPIKSTTSHDLELGRLGDFLAQFWDGDHSLAAVSSYEVGAEPRVVWRTVGSLGTLTSEDLWATSLFVPGARRSCASDLMIERLAVDLAEERSLAGSIIT